MPQSSGFDVSRLIELRRVTSLAASPCGQWLAVAAERLDEDRAKYVSELWRVPVDGSEPNLLTHGDHNDRAPAFRRDGALAFLSGRPQPRDDDAKAGRAQIWLFAPGGAEPRPLTDEPLGVSTFRLAADADRLVVLASVLPGVAPAAQRSTADDRRKHGPSALRYTEAPPRVWDHWVPEAQPCFFAYDSDGGGRLHLTPDVDGAYREVQWDLSRDGKTIVVNRDMGLADDRVPDMAIELISTDGSGARVLCHEPNTWFQHAVFSPDGRRLAVSRAHRSVERHGARELWIFDVETGSSRRLLAHWDRWPVPQCWTDAGVVVIADDHATVPVFLVDPDADEHHRVTAAGAGGTHSALVSLTGGGVAGIRSRITHPPEAFVVGLEADSVPVMPSRLSGFDESDAAFARVDSFTTPVSGAACDIQAMVVGQNDDEARPGLVWIHGGPVHAWGDAWHWRWNPLVPVSWGFRVLLPNPTGSTGFGQDLIEGIWGNTWGGQCYRDLMAVTDAFELRPDVDSEHLFAMGGSFGGYMSNWIGANTERFSAIVTHAGIYDVSAFHGVTDFPGWWILEMGGTNPWADRSAFDRYSPRTGIERWRTPTLIIHGANDFRCPIGESLALFEGLRAHGVEAELLIYPDENHWILKPRNAVTWYDSVRLWLKRYLT